MMDAVEKCFDHLDEPTIKSLVPRLEAAIKQAVGMPSKVCRVLVGKGVSPCSQSFLGWM
jgi:proteasome component ECM29